MTKFAVRLSAGPAPGAASSPSSDSSPAGTVALTIRSGAVLGWREALSRTREEVHVQTEGSGKGHWTKDRALGIAPRTSFAHGWVHRGTGRSSVATWFDLNVKVQVSGFG